MVLFARKPNDALRIECYAMMLLTLLFASCTGDLDDEATTLRVYARRYLSVRMESGYSATRAEADAYAAGDDTYAAGADDEFAIYGRSAIAFYFFKSDGSAYPVRTDGSNYITAAEMEAGSDTTHLLVQFDQCERKLPTQVVAVVNSPAALMQSLGGLSLDRMRRTVVTDGTTRNALGGNDDSCCYFLMTNSAWVDADGREVYATPIAEVNAADSREEAELHPVGICVDRLDAKVTVSNTSRYVIIHDPNVVYADAETKGYKIDGSLYARIEGWTLYNKADASYVIKDIDGVQSDKQWAGVAWNDTLRHRSYWANTPTSVSAATLLSRLALSYDDIKFAAGVTIDTHREYALENTLDNTRDNVSAATDDDNDPNTGIVLAATIGRFTVNGDFEELTVARWQSQYYTLQQLKTALANALKDTLYYYYNIVINPYVTPVEEEQVWHSIEPDDIDFQVNAADPRYVRITLSESGRLKVWKPKGQQTELPLTEVQTTLRALPQPMIWNSGMCYYYTPIKHAIGTARRPGVVRNHWYQITITGITGLGTPVYDPVVEQLLPTVAGDVESTWSLDATINVLAWSVSDLPLELQSD